MRDLRASVGVWSLGATSDRFVKEGYRADRSVKERFKLAASIAGVGGLETHSPTEVSDSNYTGLPFGCTLLSRVPKEEIREVLQTTDAIKASRLMCRMLGGEA